MSTEDGDEPIQIVYDSIQVLHEAKSVLRPPRGQWSRCLPLRNAFYQFQASEEGPKHIQIKIIDAYDEQKQELSNDVEEIPIEVDAFDTKITNAQLLYPLGPIENSKEKWKCFATNSPDICLLIMKPTAKVLLMGRFKYKVLRGHVDFFGFRQQNPVNSEWQSVFVSSVGPAASFTCLHSRKENQAKSLAKFYTKELTEFCDKDDSIDFATKQSAFVLISKVETNDHLENIVLPILENLDDFTTKNQLQEEVEVTPCLIDGCVSVNFNPIDPTLVLAVDELLKKCGGVALNNHIITCVGDKNCGKSTVMRYMTNRFLTSSHSKTEVYFLETDVGQTEFLIEGCVTLAKIDEPMINLPMFGQKTSKIVHSCLFGANTPLNDTAYYLECISKCVTVYKDKCASSDSILIVNTHGWVNEGGSELMQQIFEIIQPSCVLQIVSVGFKGFDWIDGSNFWSCQFLPSPANLARLTENSPFRSLPPRKIRHSQLISHFAKCLESPDLLGLNACKTYKIPYNKVALVCLDALPPSRILAVLNASFVGVGNVQKSLLKTHYFDDVRMPYSIPFESNAQIQIYTICIVRGIDTKTGMIYILGPIQENLLSRVNVLVHHPKPIPMEFLKPECPYVLWRKTDTVKLAKSVPKYDKAKAMIDAPTAKPMYFEMGVRLGTKNVWERLGPKITKKMRRQMNQKKEITLLQQANKIPRMIPLEATKRTKKRQAQIEKEQAEMRDQRALKRQTVKQQAAIQRAIKQPAKQQAVKKKPVKRQPVKERAFEKLTSGIQIVQQEHQAPAAKPMHFEMGVRLGTKNVWERLGPKITKKMRKEKKEEKETKINHKREITWLKQVRQVQRENRQVQTRNQRALKRQTLKKQAAKEHAAKLQAAKLPALQAAIQAAIKQPAKQQAVKKQPVKEGPVEKLASGIRIVQQEHQGNLHVKVITAQTVKKKEAKIRKRIRTMRTVQINRQKQQINTANQQPQNKARAGRKKARQSRKEERMYCELNKLNRLRKALKHDRNIEEFDF